MEHLAVHLHVGVSVVGAGVVAVGSMYAKAANQSKYDDEHGARENNDLDLF
jgi:hypothetical protein